MFDRDGNGFITRDELQTAMEMIGESLTDSQVSELLAIADLDKDGRINYEGNRNCIFLYTYDINVGNCFVKKIIQISQVGKLLNNQSSVFSYSRLFAFISV